MLEIQSLVSQVSKIFLVSMDGKDVSLASLDNCASIL